MKERAVLKKAKRVVLKIGTRVITQPRGGLNEAFLSDLGEQAAALWQRGVQLALVTSGAVHLGRQVVGLKRSAQRIGSPESISLRQAAAAVGQPQVMRHYAQAFAAHELQVAQVLLTTEDMRDRTRYLNIRNTLGSLLAAGVTPIVNENDTVSVEGVTFNENDKLAALVATNLQADALIILTDTAGLFTADPRRDPGAELIPLVQPGEDMARYAGKSGGPESRGGMAKKIEAARLAADCGVAALIADGHAPGSVARALAGEPVGTFFLPGEPAQARKLWMATATEPTGAVVVDAGAQRALTQAEGASLLPKGIVEVLGNFAAGDIIRLLGPEGGELARGQSCYSAAEVRRIQGAHSRDIAELLGRSGPPEVVHRDYLVLTAR